MKSLKKKSKKAVLSARKKRLLDRINRCKTLKELKGWEKTFQYYDVLKNDENWDEGYLFDLMEFKLRKMSQYFHTHRIVENEDWYGTLCDRAIAILNAGYKTDIVLSKDLTTYVNTRNVNRFFNPKELKFIENKNLEKYHLAMIREAKAKKLFWKFLSHYIELLWD